MLEGGTVTQLLLYSVAMVVKLVPTWCWEGWTIWDHTSSLSMHTGVLTNQLILRMPVDVLLN